MSLTSSTHHNPNNYVLHELYKGVSASTGIGSQQWPALHDTILSAQRLPVTQTNYKVSDMKSERTYRLAFNNCLIIVYSNPGILEIKYFPLHLAICLLRKHCFLSCAI